MKIDCFALAAALTLAGGITCSAQTKTWTGLGDGVSWANRFNWNLNSLPVDTDTVGITGGSGTRVVISPGNDITVQSIQCSKPFIVSGGSLTLTAGSSAFSGALTLSNSATLTAAGATLTANGATVLADSWLYVSGGGVMHFPNLYSVTNNNESPVWEADDAGSLIDLSMVTNITMSYYEVLYPRSYTGGTVDLHRVSTCTGSVQADAADGGSVIDLNGLTGRWKSAANDAISLRAQTGASIIISKVTQLENASLEVDDTGSIPTSQLNLLTNCTLTVGGATPPFSSLTNIDDTWVYAKDGGVARLTNVLWVTCGNYSPVWQADGASSLIDLSDVIGLSIGYYEVVYVEATSGGKVDLHRLVALCTGSVQVTADGSGSKVDLSGLTGFISTGNDSASLTAKNSGTILLGTQAFLLCNVDISIAPGNPVLPPTVVASGGVTLYGRAWHSYWLEKRDTSAELNPWVFAARVALTNSLEPFLPAPEPNTEYQVSEFVADPPILDLFPAPNHHSLLLIYDTPGKTNQILKASSLTNGTIWATDVKTIMTNSFRYLGTTSNSYPVRFFRAQRL